MPDITKLPVAFKHQPVVKAGEMYAQPDPSDDMVWAVCPHLRAAQSADRFWCMHCPRWEDDARYGKMQRMCFGLAQEVCKISMAILRRERKMT